MLYSRCQTHSLLATIAATTLVQATTISPALLSCLSTQLCPCAFSRPSESSPTPVGTLFCSESLRAFPFLLG